MSIDKEEYFNKIRTDRVYHGPQFKSAELDGSVKKVRYVDKPIDISELHEFFKEKDELIIRVTSNVRQLVTAKLYEDSRGIYALTIQRYSIKGKNPLKETNFTFRANELKIFLDFIETTKIIPFESEKSGKYDDSKIAGFKDAIKNNPAAIREIIQSHPDIIVEMVEKKITTSDIKAIAYRKEQLKLFELFLKDEKVFQSKKTEWNKKKNEDVWQHFFENNEWIFGFGLNFIFNASLDDKKLEQTVSGFSFNQGGKRTDALMKTSGMINSFCLAEIKTHSTELLKQVKEADRPESWAVSDKVAAGVAQIQKTVQKFIEQAKTKYDIEKDDGTLTGEQVFLYLPKSYLIIGNLEEFISENETVNEQKFSSFQLFRRNIVNPEIITFDELYTRARMIVEHNESKR